LFLLKDRLLLPVIFLFLIMYPSCEVCVTEIYTFLIIIIVIIIRSQYKIIDSLFFFFFPNRNKFSNQNLFSKSRKSCVPKPKTTSLIDRVIQSRVLKTQRKQTSVIIYQKSSKFSQITLSNFQSQNKLKKLGAIF